MKVTIDTNVDSKEEIKRVAELLLNYLNDSTVTQDNLNPSGNSNEGIFNIFTDSSGSTEKKEEKKKEPFKINDLIPYD